MVISTVNQVVYNGDGVTTAFPFTFRIIEATDIKLLLIDADGTETDITADYYVDTVNNTVYYPGYAPGAEPPAEDQPPKVQIGQKLVVYRELPITQEKDLGEKWPFYVIELGLDKLTMILQQIFDWWGRTLKISQGGSVDGFDTNVYPEAGKVVAVNEAGDGFTSVTAMTKENNAWEGKGLQIHNIAGPSSVTDAATKDYVDQILNGFVLEGDSRTVPFDTLEQLKASDIEAGQIAFTLGYHDVNDGGAGVYNIRTAALSDVDDGGSVIILDNGNVAELITDGTVNIKQFGAKGDGSTDDSTAIQNAIDFVSNFAGTVYVPYGSHRVTSPLVVAKNIRIIGNAYAQYVRPNSSVMSSLIFYDGNLVDDVLLQYQVTCSGGELKSVALSGSNKISKLIKIDSSSIQVEKCMFTQFSTYGIHLTKYFCTIKECWFDYFSGTAIYLQTANANNVVGNLFSLRNDGVIGVNASDTNGVTIDKNFFEGGKNGSVAVKLSGASLCRENTVVNNRVEFLANLDNGQTTGTCFVVSTKPISSTINVAYRNKIKNNNAFNQVIVNGNTLHHLYNIIEDNGVATDSDYYDYDVINENPCVVLEGGVATGYSLSNNSGITVSSDVDGKTKLTLTNATTNYPLFGQYVDVRNYRGQTLTLSSLITTSTANVRIEISFYKNGTDFSTPGTLIAPLQRNNANNKTFKTNVKTLLTDSAIVPDDAEYMIIDITFGLGSGIPIDNEVIVDWFKLTHRTTWK